MVHGLVRSSSKNESKTLDCLSLRQAPLDAPGKRDWLLARDNGNECSVRTGNCLYKECSARGMDGGWVGVVLVKG